MVYNEVSWGTDSSNYPPEVSKNMRPDDKVVAFIEIVEKKKGCLRRKVKDTGNRNFVAITRERVIGTVELRSDRKEGMTKKIASRDTITFNLPLAKVTSLTTTSSSTEAKGCLKKHEDRENYLIINAQGDEIKFYTGPDCTVNDQIIRSFLEVSDYF